VILARLMSSIALQGLRTWNDPPVHSGWRSLAPVLVLDGHVYWQNKKGLEALYQIDTIDDLPEESIEELLSILTSALSTIDGYLQIRGTNSMLLKKISIQRNALIQAVEAIKRGYAPGHLPSEEQRIELGRKRLREIGLR
jgi:hypothetical protein